MITSFKITSWNINGIKSLKISLKSALDNLDSDVICLQEVKTSKGAIEYKNAVVDGYNSYFSFCQTKPGYAGVSIFCRNPVVPTLIEEGLIGIIKRLSTTLVDDESICEHLNISNDDLYALESEGRAISAEMLIKHCKCGTSQSNHSVWVINVYCPMAECDNKERLHYKKLFNQLIFLSLESIILTGSHVILVGDLNIVHKQIDIAEPLPKEIYLSNRNRQWLDKILIESQRCAVIAQNQSNEAPTSEGLLVDTFRYLHPSATDCYSCWNTKIGGRQTNYGTRIDYILCDKSILSSSTILESEVLTSVMGSDHCPVTTTFSSLELIPSTRLSPFLSSNLPQFRSQAKITSFIMRTQKSTKRPVSTERSNNQSVTAKQQKLAPSKPVDTINVEALNKWKSILKGPPKAPLCSGHKVSCVYRTVLKETVNKGKGFWVCSKPNGLPGHPESRCNFFEWAK